MRALFTFLVALVLSSALRAQFSSASSEASSEEFVELSPFSVSLERDRGFAGVIGGVPSSQLIDPRTANLPANAAVSILKRADAVAVQFVLSHSGDKQEVRNQELYTSVATIEAALKRVEGTRVEQREVRFTGGDRKLFSVSRGGSTTSFASLLVLADLPAGTRVADRVKQIRDVLAATKLTGQTKYSDGSVGLYLKNPDQYRREILQKIFDDVQFMKKGFGEEFEILPNGLSGKVRSRVAAEAELELWIDYGFNFRSVREMEAAKKK